MKNKKIYLIILLFIFVLPAVVMANGGGETTGASLQPPIKPETPQELVGYLINAILGIVGSLALAMFIYGGLTWMLSSGSSEKVQKGKNILTWATIGLIVVFSAYALVRLIFSGLGIEGT